MLLLNAEALADLLDEPGWVARAGTALKMVAPGVTSFEGFAEAVQARFAATQANLDEAVASGARAQLAQVNEALANAQEKQRLLVPQGGLQAEYHVWSRTQTADDVLRADTKGLTLALRDDLRFVLEALTLISERIGA